MAQVNFSKWHGIGNDYIIVAAMDLGFTLTPARVRLLCDRHFGIGSDGILVWSGAEATGFRMDIFNPDGSKAEMCGNGIRMLAAYLYDRGIATEETLTVDTDAGLIAPSILPGGRIRVFMGNARLGGPNIAGYEGIRGESEAKGIRIEALGREFEMTFVDMGNPHCVIETDDLDGLDIGTIGPALEHHRIFPNRANIEFMKIIGPHDVVMRVWERGVGETNACGTGACAVAVAAYRTRGVGSPTKVHLTGGELLIEVGPRMEVNMTGPAEEIFSGAMSEDFVTKLQNL